MHQHFIRLIKPLASTTLAIVLAACGGGGGDTATPNNTTNSSINQAPTSVAFTTVEAATANTISTTWSLAKDDKTIASTLTYQVYLSETPNFSLSNTTLKFSQKGATASQLTGLKPATTYYLKLVVTDDDGAQTISVEKTITTPNVSVVNQAPTNVVLTSVDATSQTAVTATWVAATDDSTAASQLTYEVHIAEGGDFTPSASTLKFTGQNTLTTQLTGLIANTAYSVKLVAVDVQGLRTVSNSISVKTQSIVTPTSTSTALFKAALAYGYSPDIMAAPPTLALTQTTVSSIAGSSLVSYNSSFWRFMQGTTSQYGANSYMQWVSAFYGGTTYAANSAAVEWQHTGTTFEIKIRGALSKFRLLCGIGAGATKKDFASATITTTPADGNMYLWKVTFASSATREFRLESNGNLQWGGIFIAAGDVIAAPSTPTPPVVVMVGDSFVEGAGNQNAGAQFSVVLGRALGWNIYSAGVGSTGVNNPGRLNTAGVQKVNYQDATRILDVTAVANIKRILIWQSLNDSAYTQQQQHDGLTALITAYRAALPTTPIDIIGPTWPFGTPIVGIYGLRDAGAAVAFEKGSLFIDQLNPSHRTGTGHEVYPAPTLSAATSAGSGGPAAGTYYYTATYKDSLGETIASNELSVTTTGGSVVITRAAANANYVGIASWTLYRGTVSGTTDSRVANGIALGSLTYTDTGAATTAASPPVTNTTGLKNDGTADVYTCPDGTHPSALGGDFDGLLLARQIKQLILTQY